jgi:site-specific recombinase XerD
MKHLPLYNTEYIKHLDSFEKMLVAKNYSRGKDCACPGTVREFLFYLETKGIYDLAHVKVAEIIAYHAYLGERPNQRGDGALSDGYIRSKLYDLRIFFDHLIETKQLESSPARLPKFTFGEYKQREVVTTEEIKELYAACQTKRDKALLSLAYGCGLRRSEMIRLNHTDINLHKGILTVVNGKNGKSRIVPLSDKVIADIREYLIYERYKLLNPWSNHKDSEQAFFINNWGSRKQGLAMNNRLKHLIKRTGNKELLQKEITLHCLRHSIATHLLDKGMNITFVQKFLGHSLIDTAHLYSKRRKQRSTLLLKVA